IDPTFSYASWGAALTEASRVAQSNRLVLVLDEFTYVMQANPEVPSLIQQIWDHQLKKQSNLFLILTGSLTGIIQRTALDYQSPLYGRATASLRLQPLAGLLPQYQIGATGGSLCRRRRDTGLS
ncbi:MAG: ATP-binding protein, partial [Gammaproteobacteria bacterium]|nr:ATP-binding protein [Gammaproteobacteria bacterium]